MIAAWVAVIALVGWQAAKTARHARVSYDLYLYLGCALEFGSPSPDSTWARATRTLAAELPRDRQDYFFRSSPYRIAVASSSDNYHQQLGFYRARYLYSGLLRLGLEAGLPLMAMLAILSLLPAALLSLALFAWLAGHLHPFLAAGLAAILIGMSWLWDQGTAGDYSLDCLAQLWIFLGMAAWMEFRSRSWSTLFMVLALLTRPDSVLLALPLGAWMAWKSEDRGAGNGGVWKRALPLLLFACAYLLLQRISGSYGWWTLLHHTFVEFLAAPADWGGGFDPERYANLVRAGLFEEGFHRAPWFWALAALAWLGWWRSGSAASRQEGKPVRYALFLALILAAYAAHFLLFPVWWPRLLLSYHLALGMAAAMLWAPRLPAALRASPSSP